jgi:hypothetical protein
LFLLVGNIGESLNVSSHPSGLERRKSEHQKAANWKFPYMNFALIKMSLKAREGNFFHMRKCFELKK